MTLRTGSITGLVVALVAMLGGCSSGPPRMACTSTRVNDDIHAQWDGQHDTMVFHVTTQSGIGGLRITREDDAWPERMVLRINVPSLDSVTISNGQTKLTARFEGGRPTVHQVVGTEHCRLTHEQCQFEVLSVNRGAFTDVTIPREVCDPNCRSLEIGWVRSALRAFAPRPASRLAEIADGYGPRGDIHFAGKGKDESTDGVARSE